MATKKKPRRVGKIRSKLELEFAMRLIAGYFASRPNRLEDWNDRRRIVEAALMCADEFAAATEQPRAPLGDRTAESTKNLAELAALDSPDPTA